MDATMRLDPPRPAGLPEPLARLDRCAVMGIVNVTPDSFSDGGRWANPEAAISHAFELLDAGADLIDVGGESTRPGAQRVDAAEEAARVLPVVRALADAGVCVSVDTLRAEVARAALEAGATIVNDVSGGLVDPAMPATVAQTGAIYVLGHWRTDPARMDEADSYRDVLGEVCAELERQVAVFLAAGVDPARLTLDPGLGFSKSGDANWPLLVHQDRLAALGYPLVVGASRKRFLGAALADAAGRPRPVDGRDAGTVAVSALAAAAGAWCVRVHEVAANADAVRIARHWRAVPGFSGTLLDHDPYGVGGQ